MTNIGRSRTRRRLWLRPSAPPGDRPTPSAITAAAGSSKCRCICDTHCSVDMLLLVRTSVYVSSRTAWDNANIVLPAPHGSFALPDRARPCASSNWASESAWYGRSALGSRGAAPLQSSAVESRNAQRRTGCGAAPSAVPDAAASPAPLVHVAAPPSTTPPTHNRLDDTCS